MKKLLLLLTIMCFSFAAYAETIVLKNGSTINGKITTKDAKKIKIEVDGAPMTYYMDEINTIDGQSVAATTTAPVADKAVAQEPADDMAADEPAPEAVKPKAVVPKPITPVDPAKKALILKFIDVFGTKAAMAQNLQAMTESLPTDNPDYQKIKKGVNVDEIIDRLVPVYDKYFSEADLKDYIEFYSSEKGKKLIDAISKVMRESVDVSAEYFQEKFPEAQ